MFADEGIEWLAAQLQEAIADEVVGVQIGIRVTDWTPTEEDTYGGMTESGYISVASGVDKFPDPPEAIADHVARLRSTLIEYTNTTGESYWTAYGWVLCVPSAAKLLCAKKFATPKTLNPGNTISFQIELTLNRQGLA